MRVIGDVCCGIQEVLCTKTVPKENKMRVAYQLSPVGIEIGSNHLRFTSEIGYGLQGILNFGLVWHLGKQL